MANKEKTNTGGEKNGVELTLFSKIAIILIIAAAAVSLFFVFKGMGPAEEPLTDEVAEPEEPFIAFNESFPSDDPLKDVSMFTCLALKNDNLSYCEKIMDIEYGDYCTEEGDCPDVDLEYFRNDCNDRYWMKKAIWEEDADYCVHFKTVSEEFCRKRFNTQFVERDCLLGSEDEDAIIRCNAWISQDYNICYQQSEENQRGRLNCRLILNDPSVDCEKEVVRYDHTPRVSASYANVSQY